MVHTRRFTVIAIVCGILACILVFLLLAVLANSRRQAIEEAGETVEVVTVTQDVPIGTVLTEDMLQVRPRIKGDLPDGTVLEQAENAIDHVTLVPLFSGEPVMEAKLGGGDRSGPSSYVTPGHVAFALDLPPERAVGGVVQVGDRIDVLSTGETDTQVLLADVSVIGIAGEFPFTSEAEPTPEPSGSSESSSRFGQLDLQRILILDLTPEEAILLADALQRAEVSITLHSVRP